VTTGTREAGRSLRTDLRRQVASAGLGPAVRQQLARQALPEPEARRGEPGVHEGAAGHPCLRRGRGDPEPARALLASPTENAPRKGADGRRISPRTFPEHRFGPLRFVSRPTGPSLLVVDGLRASFSRQTGELRGFWRATEQARARGHGLTTVVMFLLVPQVELRKRLNVTRAAERWSAQLPALIEQQLRSD
jgi:Family of unknown function (DUF6441)